VSTSGGSSGGGAGLLVATVHLNAAAIQTMFSAPTLVAAAPGLGFMYGIVTRTVYEFVAGVDGFSQNSGLSPGTFYGNAPTTATRAEAVADLDEESAPAATHVGFGSPVAPNVSAQARAVFANKGLYVGCLNFDPERVGPIVTATLDNGGAGYVAGDTGTIDADPIGNTGGAAYVVDTVDGGAVLTFTVTGAGDGYSTLSNPLPTTVGGAQPGVGVGLTVNVTAIPPPDGDLYATVVYRVVALH
jgi:hypothetical protein